MTRIRDEGSISILPVRPSTSLRPLTTRSVLASVLLGTDPPWLPTSLLVATAALFDLRESAVRTALSRMTAAGEVVARDGGYALAGPLLERRDEQRAGRRAERRAWDGTWELCVIAPGARPPRRRAELRRALNALHLAEWREGIWLRPDNLDPDRSPQAGALVAPDVERWHGARPDATGDRRLAAAWDLVGWAAGALRLLDRLPPIEARLAEEDTGVLAEGFVVSAAVLRHLRADPLLPDELLPPRWPGAELRSAYDRFDGAYRAVLSSWFAAHRVPPRDRFA